MELTLKQKYILGLKELGITNTALAKELNFSKQYIGLLVKCKRKNELFTKWMENNVLPIFDGMRSIK